MRSSWCLVGSLSSVFTHFCLMSVQIKLSVKYWERCWERFKIKSLSISISIFLYFKLYGMVLSIIMMLQWQLQCTPVLKTDLHYNVLYTIRVLMVIHFHHWVVVHILSSPQVQDNWQICLLTCKEPFFKSIFIFFLLRHFLSFSLS